MYGVQSTQRADHRLAPGHHGRVTCQAVIVNAARPCRLEGIRTRTINYSPLAGPSWIITVLFSVLKRLRSKVDLTWLDFCYWSARWNRGKSNELRLPGDTRGSWL